MQICLMEANKKVKALNDELAEILREEAEHCQTSYRSVDEKIEYKYDFQETRKEVAEISAEILNLKRLINIKNNETKIGIGDRTISDALIEVALINKELERLVYMNKKEKLTSRVDMRNDSVIYTELLYEPEVLNDYITQQKNFLVELQMGIDRANLNTYIEY